MAALAAYLTHDQRVPYPRTGELLGALAGIALFPATLQPRGRQAAARRVGCAA
jgi:hypothetical protein